jgi:hypothetical protein
MDIMKPVIQKWIIILFGVVIGYGLMVLLITSVQEWIFHGVSYNKSSIAVLVIAGLGTFLSAVAGGWVAFRINSGKTRLSNMIMSVMVVIETTWILLTFKADSPLWFDILAALSLIIGIMLSCNLVYLRRFASQK